MAETTEKKTASLAPISPDFEDAAELQAIVLQLWLMSVPVAPSTSLRMLIEGTRWINDYKAKKHSDSEKAFKLLARMFLEDYADKMKQSGQPFYNKDVVRAVRRMTGWKKDIDDD